MNAPRKRRSLEKIIRRKADGSLWAPSHPDWMTPEIAAVQCLMRPFLKNPPPLFYFRALRRIRRRFWFDYWLLSDDEIWEPEDASAFDIITNAKALERINDL